MPSSMRSITAGLIVLGALVLSPGSARAAVLPFINGFDTDLSGWDVDAFGEPAFMKRVPSGTHGITSRTGSFHAESDQSKLECDDNPPLIQCGGETAATNWGGYGGVPGCSSTSCAAGTFPAGGYTTSLDIYLDVGGQYGEDTRFDYTSSISTPSGEFRRQFVFNAGFYRDSSAGGALGAGPRFIVSASNSAGRSRSSPTNPANDPFVITASGWYTFRHRFSDSGNGHVLAVELAILDASGALLHRWTLSDPSDVIGGTIGGNRYGWLASQEFPFLAIDHSSRCGAICFDFSGQQYGQNFRDVRRGSDIFASTDVAGDRQPSLNLTGGAGAAGDTWVTVYDPSPDAPTPTIVTGSLQMSMDVVFGPFNNRKGLGLLALYSEGAGAPLPQGCKPPPASAPPKGLAVVVFENGNTDNLALVTVKHDPRTRPLPLSAMTRLATVPLGARVSLTTWYRLTVDLEVTTTTVTATGTLYRHVNPADPTSAVTPVRSPVRVSRALGSLGLGSCGEIGIVGASIGAVMDSSVTNFTATQ